MRRRIFPIDDWAPAQEAIYDEPARMPGERHGPGPAQPSAQPGESSQSRMRSVSLSFPWRNRPKSAVFSVDELAEQMPDLSLEAGGSGRGDVDEAKQQRRSRGGPGQHQGGLGNPRGRRHLKGMIRQASVSIKGFMPRRTSLLPQADADGQRLPPQSSHAHSQSFSAFNALEQGAGRPTTAHSTWRRLRQATSFRHSRVLNGYPSLETILSPRHAAPDAPAFPMPGPMNGPPIIPLHTGGAARAAAAAFQNDAIQRKWFYPEEYQNDRESGIGIAVTSSESEFSGLPDVDHERDAVETDDMLSGITKVDFISFLPTELAISILVHLDASGLAAASRVSRSWHMVVSNQHVWRESFLRENTNTYATSAPLLPGTGHGVPAVRPDNDWRQIYRVKQDLDRRWKEGKAVPVYLNGHSDSIYCLQFDEYVPVCPCRPPAGRSC